MVAATKADACESRCHAKTPTITATANSSRIRQSRRVVGKSVAPGPPKIAAIRVANTNNRAHAPFAKPLKNAAKVVTTLKRGRKRRRDEAISRSKSLILINSLLVTVLTTMRVRQPFSSHEQFHHWMPLAHLRAFSTTNLRPSSSAERRYFGSLLGATSLRTHNAAIRWYS